MESIIQIVVSLLKEKTNDILVTDDHLSRFSYFINFSMQTGKSWFLNLLIKIKFFKFSINFSI